MQLSNIISVVIVNYNAGKYLTECVKSVLKSKVDIEILISDNASTDNSISMLRKEIVDLRVKIFENPVNLGFSRANNMLVPRTGGDYILFLNPDCIVQPDTIQKMQEAMNAHPNVGMAGCRIHNSDGTIQNTCIRRLPNPSNSFIRIFHLNKIFPQKQMGLDLGNQWMPEKISTVEAISGAFMFVRRTALEQVGFLDENYFLYGEDLDWMTRFHQMGWKILFVPNTEIIHAKSICGREIPYKILWYKHAAMIRYYQKFLFKKYFILVTILVYMGIVARFFLLTTMTFFQRCLMRRVDVVITNEFSGTVVIPRESAGSRKMQNPPGFLDPAVKPRDDIAKTKT